MSPDKSGNRIRFDLSAEGFNAGEQEFEIRFANVLLPESPKCVVTYGDQVVLTGKGLAHAQCGEPAIFTIDGSKAGPGNPEVTLHAEETNLPVPVMISLAGEKIWRATYTLNNPGNYLLSVLWADRPVKGCPLIVEAKGGADASKVIKPQRIRPAIIIVIFRYYVLEKDCVKELLEEKYVLGSILEEQDQVNLPHIALVHEKWLIANYTITEMLRLL